MTHIALGKQTLEQLGLLPAAVATILGRHAVAYLYGCVAADVVFAKRLSRVRQFCHHWSTAFGLLENAKDDQSKAFSYGYLSHLAADTVAHGKYVPRQMVVSTCTVNFGHLYWELRADNNAGDAPRALFADTLTHDHWKHDAALAGHLHDTFFPFDLNRAIFHRMNSLALNERFQQTINIWSRCSRWPLSQEVLSGYLSESGDRILSILTDEKKSALLREDPNGTSALMQVRVHRRQVRRLRIRGLPTAHRVREAAQALAPVCHFS